VERLRKKCLKRDAGKRVALASKNDCPSPSLDDAAALRGDYCTPTLEPKSIPRARDATPRRNAGGKRRKTRQDLKGLRALPAWAG
jgi:hypothetical protein